MINKNENKAVESKIRSTINKKTIPETDPINVSMLVNIPEGEKYLLPLYCLTIILLGILSFIKQLLIFNLEGEYVSPLEYFKILKFHFQRENNLI